MPTPSGTVGETVNWMSLPDAKRERYSVAMKKSSTPSLTLHGLITALSFWGTAVRTLLFGFLAGAVFLVALSEAESASAIDTEVMVLIYVVGSFLLLDFGYVTVARAYKLLPGLDMLMLAAAELLLAALYIAPRLVVNPEVSLRADPLLFVIFVPLIVLSIRSLVGMLFGSRTR